MLAPASARTPTATMLLRGMWRFGSMAPKNDLGSAFPRPIPQRSRPAASCEPIPEPMLATRSPHPVEEPSGGELRAHTGTHVGHEQREVHDLEENDATDLTRDQGKGRLNLVTGERFRSPDKLGGIHFESGEDTGNQTNHDRGQKNVAARILNLLRERGHGVEADVGEYSYRSTGKDSRQMESVGLVEGMGKESGIVVNVP